MNTNYWSVSTSGFLIGDLQNYGANTTPASGEGGPDILPTPTVQNAAFISACLELQSTTGALCLPRMTTAQRNALAQIANGFVIYNTSTTAFNFYQNGGWVALSAGAGGVVGPGGGSTDKAIARWNGAGGNTLQDSVVIVGDTGILTGVLKIDADAGTAALPSYSFTGDTDTGIYHSAANTVDISANGLRQVSVVAAGATVNYLQLNGSATGVTTKITALADGGGDANIGIELVPLGTGAVVGPVGALATPGYSFTGDLDTGIWHSGANTLDFSTNAFRVLQLAASPALTVNYATLTASATGNAVVLATAGTDATVNLQLFPKGTTTGQVVHPVGAVATPSLTFLARTDTGFWSSAAATIDASTTGGRQFQIDNVAAAVNWLSVTGGATVAAGAGPGEPVLSANGTDTLVDVAIKSKGALSGLSLLPNTAAGAGLLKLWNGAGTFNASIQGGNIGSNILWTWAITDAGANADATTISTPLASNGAGVLSFADTGYKYATGSLTSAQIKALFDTPVELIPAPGANKMVVIQGFALQVLFNTAAYTAGGAVYLQYGAAAHGGNFATPVAGIPSAFVTGVAANSSVISTSGQIDSTTGLVIGSAANAAITITNATQDFATGLGTANWFVWYSIVPTS